MTALEKCGTVSAKGGDVEQESGGECLGGGRIPPKKEDYLSKKGRLPVQKRKTTCPKKEDYHLKKEVGPLIPGILNAVPFLKV